MTNQEKFIETFGKTAWEQMIYFTGVAEQYKEFWTSPYQIDKVWRNKDELTKGEDKMKYVIDIPDNVNFINLIEYGADGACEKVYSMPAADLDLMGVDNIEDKVWDLAYFLLDEKNQKKCKECYGRSGLDVIRYMSYQEAQYKYDKWLEKKKKIIVGDEIKCKDNSIKDTAIITSIDNTEAEFVYMKDGIIGACPNIDKYWEKTGRHFSNVKEFYFSDRI